MSAAIATKLDEALAIACRALDQISNFADPYEIAEEPEAFGGTDDGHETVCMAYENIQSIATIALSRVNDVRRKIDDLARGESA